MDKRNYGVVAAKPKRPPFAARPWQDQGCGSAGNPGGAAIESALPSKTDFVGGGASLAKRVIMYEMLRAGVCVVYIAEPTQPLKAWVLIPVKRSLSHIPQVALIL